MKKIWLILFVALVSYLVVKISYGFAATEPITEAETLQLENYFKATSTEIKIKPQALSHRVAGQVLPDSNLYQFKLFGEWLRINLAKNELSAERLRVELLNRRLAEAQAMLEAGKTGMAQPAINKFVEGSQSLSKRLKEQDYLRKDAASATQIENAVKGQIVLQKTLMLNVGTSSPLYPIKKSLSDLELELADTPKEKAIVLERQANEKRFANKIVPETLPARNGDYTVLKDQIALVYREQKQKLTDTNIIVQFNNLYQWLKYELGRQKEKI